MKRTVHPFILLIGPFMALAPTSLLASQGDKLAATGIMYLCDDAEGPLQDQPSHFNNPSVDGLIFRTAWNEMEQSEGNCNWSKVDAMLAAAQAAHKPMGLSVTAGFRSPAWLAGTGTQMMTGSLVRSFAPTRTVSMPYPWDLVYQEKWGAFLRALGQRYDQNPQLAYVTMAGMGFAVEPVMAKTAADIEQFREAGGLPAWVRGSEQIIDIYAQAFPHTPFLLAMLKPVSTPDADDALAQVVDYGLEKYPGRFGVMYHGLNASASELDYYDRTVRDNADKTTVGYQMVWSTHGKNAEWLLGSLENCLESGVRMKAHFIEVYAVDCDDPAYSALLRRIGAELKSQNKMESKGAME